MKEALGWRKQLEFARKMAGNWLALLSQKTIDFERKCNEVCINYGTARLKIAITQHTVN